MEEYFESLVKYINKELVKGIRVRNRLDEAVLYSLTNGGKRLRPLLFLTFLNSHLNNYMKYIDIAIAIEYIHTYTLVHDDLPSMDDDDLRRGKPTVHKKFDEATAVLCGDALQTLAYERIAYSKIDSDKKVEIIKILTLSTGIRGVAEGQILDLNFNGNKDDILRIHGLKTAELLKASVLSAGVILDYDMRKMSLIEEGMYNIGVAFQLSDDLLDFRGDEGLVGKRVRKDKENKSPNSVLFFGEQEVENMMKNFYENSVSLFRQLDIDFEKFYDLLYMMVFRSK